MSAILRREVLKCFKSLHKTRQRVFEGDQFALQKGRERINEEFKKHVNVENTEAIKELINQSKAVEVELLTTVVQAKEIEPGKFEMHIRPEVEKLNNVPYSCPN